MTKQKEIEILQSLGDKGAYIHDMQAAKYLTGIKQFVDLTIPEENTNPNEPYFFAKLNHRGGVYLAMLRREYADNRTSSGRIRF